MHGKSAGPQSQATPDGHHPPHSGGTHVIRTPIVCVLDSFGIVLTEVNSYKWKKSAANHLQLPLPLPFPPPLLPLPPTSPLPPSSPLDPEEIYKGNMTIIMGLVWTMIQKYQIKTSGVTVTTRRVGPEWQLSNVVCQLTCLCTVGACVNSLSHHSMLSVCVYLWIVCMTHSTVMIYCLH